MGEIANEDYGIPDADPSACAADTGGLFGAGQWSQTTQLRSEEKDAPPTSTGVKPINEKAVQKKPPSFPPAAPSSSATTTPASNPPGILAEVSPPVRLPSG